MGAIVYETGGLLIDNGWLRLLGSGHDRLTRTLPSWNHERSAGYLLVGGDVIGGFFAINGGALGPDPSKLYYWAPEYGARADQTAEIIRLSVAASSANCSVLSLRTNSRRA
jgi:hypothetical protein